jgi:hypothetical protein
MKDELKPHILGMCETFLNEEKCKMNSRELDLDNFVSHIPNICGLSSSFILPILYLISSNFGRTC